jgi:hypothetical protein
MQKGFTQITTMYPIGDNYIFNWDINSGNLKIYYPGNLHLGSAQGNMLGTGNFTVEGSANADITAKEINFKNTHIGSSDPNFKVHASTKSFELACNFNSTASVPEVPLYEKIEYGIELPDEIQEKINLFLNSNSSAANPNHPGLNPYDPQDISVEASITHTINDTRYNLNTAPPFFTPQLSSTITVYGFYYQEASPTADLTGWTVNEQTDYPFRIRFAPPYLGDYVITFKIVYWDNGSYHTIDLDGVSVFPDQPAGTFGFNFKAVANTSGKAIAKGYLEVGKHKRHLRHSYDKTSFFPIGMNVPQGIGSNSNNDNGAFNKPEGMANRRYEFSQLAANGGNYTRILSFGDREGGPNCVEITHRRDNDPYFLIGNYQINQDKMMETDRDVACFEDNGIFATWCLQTYGFDDMPDTNHYYATWSINPYKYELNHDQVTDFFTANDCQRFFRNRLRYIQARWGYSASIAIYQLDSEIDDFGRYGENGHLVNPYRVNSSYAEKGHNWQITMAGQLKSIYPNHLISSSYVANPTGQLIASEFPIVCHDTFIYGINCDIVSWNPYALASSTNSAEELNRGRWDAVNQIIYNPTNIEYCNPDLGRFTDKPVFFSEAGMNDKFNIDPYTDIQMHNMIWATACSGMLGAGLAWQGWEAYTSGSQIEKKFHNFSALNSFFDDIDFEANNYKPSNTSFFQLDHGGGAWGDNDDNIITWFEGNKIDDNHDLMDKMEIFVMQDATSSPSNKGFGWLHNKHYNWNVEIEDSSGIFIPTNTPFSSIYFANVEDDKTKYLLNGFEQGKYVIVVYDTKTGAELLTTHAWANFANILKLKIPFVTLDENHPDVAFKFWRVNISGSDLRTNDSFISQATSQHKDDTKYDKIQSINVYPNPTQHIINVEYFDSEKGNYKLIDCTGKIILEGILQQNNTATISLNEYATGIYNLIIYNSSASINYKIIKQ